MSIKLTCFIIGMFLVISVFAQSYNISFSATGASSSVDSVKVENLTQCTSLDISGQDVLNLVSVIGIGDLNSNNEKSFSIYPNPFDKVCIIEFEMPASGTASFYVCDMNGKQIIKMKKDLQQGTHHFKLRGLNKGVYVIQIKSESFTHTGKLLSYSNSIGMPDIVFQGSGITNQDRKELFNAEKKSKNPSALIQMQYNTGDVLKFTGKSGIYRTVYMLVPTTNQTVTFTFIACTDSDGNHYAVVKIGAQWWMAENLNAGTYVPVASPQVSGTKFCMDINGQEDPTCPMGGLYEWEILMQGASDCNGTGAPPNDKCPVPVKGLCPDGWHIPSHYEWNTLARNAGSNPTAFLYDMDIGVLGTEEGGHLKKTCTSYWWDPNEGATDLTGFTALPGGDTWEGIFEDFGQSAYFWTTTMSFGYLPWVYALNYSLPSIGRSYYVRENGFSCRCVKN